jgi:non-ribosomal peptide synthetase component E (peptide arylation enzyme)
MIVVHPYGRREQWTFAELSRASNQLATAWRAAGIRRGDRVAGLVSRPVAYYTGDNFRPAPRLPVEPVTFVNRWGVPPDVARA